MKNTQATTQATQEQKMDFSEFLKHYESADTLNSISKDFLNEYGDGWFDNFEDILNENLISDAMQEYADEMTDIYNSDLINWLKEDDDAVWYFERAVKEYGIERKDFDLYRTCAMAQCLQNEDHLYADESLMIEILEAYNDYLDEDEDSAAC